MLTPSWTRAFQVCSSFLMNLQGEETPEPLPSFRAQGFSGGHRATTTAGAPGTEGVGEPQSRGTEAACCSQRPPPSSCPFVPLPASWQLLPLLLLERK